MVNAVETDAEDVGLFSHDLSKLERSSSLLHSKYRTADSRDDQSSPFTSAIVRRAALS